MTGDRLRTSLRLGAAGRTHYSVPPGFAPPRIPARSRSMVRSASAASPDGASSPSTTFISSAKLVASSSPLSIALARF
jgi:hypothetical protein